MSIINCVVVNIPQKSLNKCEYIYLPKKYSIANILESINIFTTNY